MSAFEKPEFAEETIYICLLDEGTEVARPTRARRHGNGVYLVLPTPDYDPGLENWEFPPGSIVQVQECDGADGTYLLAISIAADQI
jgi:hypothetical protein